ncbi:hypothetical protein IAU60_003779 [Kwoniella sp. DSM 27419]
MSQSSDPDLRDVFALLYAEDDWSFGSDEEDGPSDGSGAKLADGGGAEVDVVEKQINEPQAEQRSTIEEGTETYDTREKYTRKRFLDALDSLFLPIDSSQDTGKRQRIYPRSPLSQPSIVPSTQHVPDLPSPTAYAPYSPLALLARIRTFKAHSYSPLLPDTLSPVQVALTGWVNSSVAGVSCGTCSAKWDVKGVLDIKDEAVRKEVARRLSGTLQNRHDKGCAWRTRPSPDNLHIQLRHLLHPLISSSLAPLAEQLSASTTTSDLAYTSPLSPIQSDNLVSTLSHHASPSASASASASTSSSAISTTTAQMALFGWYPYYPNEPSDHITPVRAASETQTASSAPAQPTVRRTDIIHCRICQRRIGLWAFARRPPGDNSAQQDSRSSSAEAARTLDLVDEHLSWCPIRPASRGKGQEWWTGCALLEQRSDATASPISRPSKGWVAISDKLEKKPWRR